MIRWGCPHPCDNPSVVHGHRVCDAPACALALIGVRTTKRKLNFRREDKDDPIEDSSGDEEEQPQLTTSRKKVPLQLVPQPPGSGSSDRVRPASPEIEPPRSSLDSPQTTPRRRYIPKRWRNTPKGLANLSRLVAFDPWLHNGDDDILDSEELHTELINPILGWEERVRSLDVLAVVLQHFEHSDIYRRLITDQEIYNNALVATCQLYLYLLVRVEPPSIQNFLVPRPPPGTPGPKNPNTMYWQRMSREDAILLDSTNREPHAPPTELLKK